MSDLQIIIDFIVCGFALFGSIKKVFKHLFEEVRLM